MINLKNVLENLIYIAAIGILLIVNNRVTIGRFEGMMEAAVAKHTTSILNEYNTDIKKFKAHKGSTVDFQIKPVTDNTATTIIVNDSIEDKPGFFKRLFGKKDK